MMDSSHQVEKEELIEGSEEEQPEEEGESQEVVVSWRKNSLDDSMGNTVKYSETSRKMKSQK